MKKESPSRRLISYSICHSHFLATQAKGRAPLKAAVIDDLWEIKMIITQSASPMMHRINHQLACLVDLPTKDRNAFLQCRHAGSTCRKGLKLGLEESKSPAIKQVAEVPMLEGQEKLGFHKLKCYEHRSNRLNRLINVKRTIVPCRLHEGQNMICCLEGDQ